MRVCTCMCVCARVVCVYVIVYVARVYVCPCVYTHMCRVGQNHIPIRCIYGILGREITKYTIIYGVYKRFWPTLYMCACANVYVHVCVCMSCVFTCACVCACIYACMYEYLRVACALIVLFVPHL